MGHASPQAAAGVLFGGRAHRSPSDHRPPVHTSPPDMPAVPAAELSPSFPPKPTCRAPLWVHIVPRVGCPDFSPPDP